MMWRTMKMITTPSMRTCAHYDDVSRFRSVPKNKHREVVDDEIKLRSFQKLVIGSPCVT